MARHLFNDDTIAAIATPMGQAGIGIVRMSGPLAGTIAQRIFKPRRNIQGFQSHRLYLGHLVDPLTGNVMDQVLLSFMKAPHSYTTEDVVEINSHSGSLLLGKILQTVVSEGARLAKPGEFTFRAFMNGRIDLTQAEAIVDLIHSQSEKGLQLAANQMKGILARQVKEVRGRVLEILSHLEVAIDFPGEAEIFSATDMEALLREEIIPALDHLIAAYSQRKVWMEGLGTVIVGRVNAGKSSLLNRLLNEEKAIVTPIPGTTRDIIESTIHMEGIPLRLMDTAGFRMARGEIEKMGLKRTAEKLAEADLLLVVIDRSRPLNQVDLDILKRSTREKSIIIFNKIDLPSRLQEKLASSLFEGFTSVSVSAQTGEGIAGLRRSIVCHVLTGQADLTSSQVIPNLRQKEALEQAVQHFKNAAGHVRAHIPMEIIAEDLNGGLESLGDIIGETTHEDLLDKIFSQFCLGK